MIAERFLARIVSSIQQALEGGGLDGVYWAPGAENPADGLDKVRSAMAPLLGPLESVHSNPGSLRQLKGVVWEEKAGHGKREN